jgi:hypothetical protein
VDSNHYQLLVKFRVRSVGLAPSVQALSSDSQVSRFAFSPERGIRQSPAPYMPSHISPHILPHILREIPAYYTVLIVARSRQVCINWVVEALLVVYLTEEEKDIYIGIRRCLPPWFCRPNPFSHLGVVAVVYRTEKTERRVERLYRTSRCTANSGKGA